MSEAAWFEVRDRREVYRGYSTVRVDTVRMPDGTDASREVVVRPDAVAVIPVTDDGRILLLRQYRHPFERYHLEIPAGLVDEADDSPEATARRELAEELEHEAGTLEHLATFHNSAGWSTERTHLYLGTDLRRTSLPEGFSREGEEAVMEVVPFTVADALELAAAGELPDAKTALGLLLAAPRLRPRA